jgi:hypothetical protein
MVQVRKLFPNHGESFPKIQIGSVIIPLRKDATSLNHSIAVSF